MFFLKTNICFTFKINHFQFIIFIEAQRIVEVVDIFFKNYVYVVCLFLFEFIIEWIHF